MDPDPTRPHYSYWKSFLIWHKTTQIHPLHFCWLIPHQVVHMLNEKNVNWQNQSFASLTGSSCCGSPICQKSWTFLWQSLSTKKQTELLHQNIVSINTNLSTTWADNLIWNPPAVPCKLFEYITWIIQADIAPVHLPTRLTPIGLLSHCWLSPLSAP